MEIRDKVVIITGGGQGIGLATAKNLSKLGAKVVIADKLKTIKNLEKEIPNSLSIFTDMLKKEDIKRLIEQTIKKYKRIDLLINNAGQGIYGNVENINLENYKKIMELNVYSVLIAMQKVLPIMRKQRGGMIINVGSIVTKTYTPGVGAYSSTKYAINALSFIARQELEKDNIIVSVINPRRTLTDFPKNSIGGRPNWVKKSSNKPVDKPESVAKKIAEIIKSEVREISL